MDFLDILFFCQQKWIHLLRGQKARVAQGCLLLFILEFKQSLSLSICQAPRAYNHLN